MKLGNILKLAAVTCVLGAKSILGLAPNATSGNMTQAQRIEASEKLVDNCEYGWEQLSAELWTKDKKLLEWTVNTCAASMAENPNAETRPVLGEYLRQRYAPGLAPGTFDCKVDQECTVGHWKES